MTLLRRTAQFVQDLRIIGAIKENDKVFSSPFGCKYGDKNCINLIIQYERGDEQANRRAKRLIGECFFEEFSKDECRIEEYSEKLANEFSVTIFRKI